MFNFVFLCPKRWFQINSRTVRRHFSSIMTLNNWKKDCRKAKLHFQMTFSLPSTSCLLKLPNDDGLATVEGTAGKISEFQVGISNPRPPRHWLDAQTTQVVSSIPLKSPSPVAQQPSFTVVRYTAFQCFSPTWNIFLNNVFSFNHYKSLFT